MAAKAQGKADVCTAESHRGLLAPRKSRKSTVSVSAACPVVYAACMRLEVSLPCIFRAVWLLAELESLGFVSGSEAEMIAAVVFLACKALDEPRRPRDALNCVHAALVGDQQLLPLGSTYQSLKKNLIAREALMLRFLRFDVGDSVQLPHVSALQIAKRVHPDSAQLAVACLNDALANTLAMDARACGAAAVLLACALLGVSKEQQLLAVVAEDGVSPDSLWDALKALSESCKRTPGAPGAAVKAGLEEAASIHGAGH